MPCFSVNPVDVSKDVLLCSEQLHFFDGSVHVLVLTMLDLPFENPTSMLTPG